MRREVIDCTGVPRSVMGSQAVQAGDFVFVGGQIPSDYAGGLAPEVKQKSHGIIHPAALAKIQSEYILNNTEAILSSAGSSLSYGARIDQFVTRPEAASPYLEARDKFVRTAVRPASTHIQIQDFLVPNCLVGLQVVGVRREGRTSREIIDVGKVPKSPGGPFSGGPQAVTAGDFVFLTGQIASDFKTGVVAEAQRNPNFWYGSAVKLQTSYVLRRLQIVLEEGGSSLANVVKADVWLVNVDDYPEFEAVWTEFFPENPPARSILPVRRLSHVDCLIEINMIAVKDKGTAKKETVTAKGVPASPAHQPHAVQAGDFLFLSGLLATEGDFRVAREASVHPEMPWFGSPGKRQTEHILGNMEKICRAAGSSLKDVVWTQAFYTDLREFAPSLEVWQKAFPQDPPAAFACQVHSPHWIPGCTIQMDAVALL